MLQLYLHRLVMLIGLIAATVLLLCYRRRLLWCYVVIAVLLVVGFLVPNPIRSGASQFRHHLLVQVYKTKYVRKKLTYARSELGVPVNILQQDDLLIWEYEHLMVVSRDSLTVSEIRMPSGGRRN